MIKRIYNNQIDNVCFVNTGFLGRNNILVMKLVDTVNQDIVRKNIKRGKEMTLYVVHGNTCYNGYGHMENIFGVYTEKDAAEAAKDLVTKQLYDENKDDKYTIVNVLSDIEVGILEIEADKLVDFELGGYFEWV